MRSGGDKGDIQTIPGVLDLSIGSRPRSPGTHVSDILRLIAMRLHLWEDEEPNPVVMAMGLAWEEWLSKQHPEWHYHFGEVELDGIIGTPDAFELDSETVHEFKFTYKTSTHPIDREWYWWSQLKCYCKMLGVRKGCLHVLHINGDYHGNLGQYLIHKVEFSQQEIDALWQTVARESQFHG